jgi:NitT/TauT family transport system permease protein
MASQIEVPLPVEGRPPSTMVSGVAVAEEPSGNRWRALLGRGPVSRETRRRSLIVHAIQLGLLVIALGVWEWIGHGSKTQNLTVSTPWDVAKWIGRWAVGNEAHGWDDLLATLEEGALGWLLGIFIGVGLAVTVASSKWIRLFAAPFVSVLNALPKIALAPIFILVFGETLSSKVYFVTAGIFFITFYNVFGGLRSIDVSYLRNARILGASRIWLVREVYAPAITGWVMTSLRLTAAWALTAAVIAEYLGSVKGMGYIVATGQNSAQVPEVIGGILVVAFAALVIDRVIVRIERYFTRWRLS